MSEEQTAGQSKSSSTPLKCQNGLVGFFDILGYRAFLENNSADSAAEKVLSSLLNLKHEIPQRVLEQLRALSPSATPTRVENVGRMLSEINWLIFSDTILLALSLENVETPQNYYGLFLLQCSYLWRTMFNFGLPLRGAITKGQFLIYDTCFAGESIVEAYRWATDLDCAGVVIIPELQQWGSETTDKYSFTIPYLLPTKSHGPMKGNILNVAHLPPKAGEAGAWRGDLRQLVHECFWKHGKDMDEDAVEKLQNTERLLRFLRFRFPSGFQ